MSIRLNWLQKIIGKDKAAALKSDLQQATVALDAVGLERKAADDNQPPEGEQTPNDQKAPPPEQPPEGDPVHEAAVKLGQQIYDATGGDPAKMTPENFAKVIEDTLRPAVEGGDTQESQDMTQEPNQEQEQQKAKATPVGASQSDAEVTKKALGLIEQMVTDQGDIAKSVVDQGVAIEEINKSLKPIVEDLARQVSALSERLNMTPRSASSDASTVLDTNGRSKAGKTAKSIEAEITNGLKGGGQTVLGIPVTE